MALRCQTIATGSPSLLVSFRWGSLAVLCKHCPYEAARSLLPSLQGPKCVVYSFGSNGEVSFERALIGMTHGACEVHVFDFSLSPKQVQQVQAIHGVTFHDYGIGADNRVVTDPFVYEARNVTSYELKSLPTIMAGLGHEWIDVLKMDVEGAEYGILQAIVQHYQNAKQVIPVTQAQVEYHHHDEQPSRHDLLTTLILLERSGFRAMHFIRSTTTMGSHGIM